MCNKNVFRCIGKVFILMTVKENSWTTQQRHEIESEFNRVGKYTIYAIFFIYRKGMSAIKNIYTLHSFFSFPFLINDYLI